MSDTVRMRRLEQSRSAASGRIHFDDRGNAFWQTSADDDPLARLDTPELKLADDVPRAGIDPAARYHGYNPYGDRAGEGFDRPKKRDLRQLSKWIESRRRATQAEDAD